ncbi:hypothetical protein HZS_1048, partial [Henneguya salminicola]
MNNSPNDYLKPPDQTGRSSGSSGSDGSHSFQMTQPVPNVIFPHPVFGNIVYSPSESRARPPFMYNVIISLINNRENLGNSSGHISPSDGSGNPIGQLNQPGLPYNRFEGPRYPQTTQDPLYMGINSDVIHPNFQTQSYQQQYIQPHMGHQFMMNPQPLVNVVPTVPNPPLSSKKQLRFIYQIIVSELPLNCGDISLGNSITCNTEDIYFSLGIILVLMKGNNKVGSVLIQSSGKQNFSVPTVIASSRKRISIIVEPIVSLTSTCLNPTLFASACETEGIKIWKKSSTNSTAFVLKTNISPSNNVSLINDLQERTRNLLFHPCTDEIISYVSNKGFTVSSILNNTQILSVSKNSSLQSLSWKADGSAVCCFEESGTFLVFDPRQPQTCESFNQSFKNMKIIWENDTPYVLGFGSQKEFNNKIVVAIDTRNSGNVLSKQNIDSSIGYMFPCYDSDTGMIVVASKGGNSIYFLEFTSSGLTNPRMDNYSEPTYGLCSLPRNLLNVMSCEVMRILHLGKSSISPLSYIVPRKSYSSFYPELFPDVSENVSSLNAEQWLSGENKALKKVSLEPSSNKTQGDLTTDEQEKNTSQADTVYPDYTARSLPSFVTNTELQSKFKNIYGTKLHKDFQHEMINNINQLTCVDSNGASAYCDTLAVSLSGTAGRLGILQVFESWRIFDCGPFYLENKAAVLDFDIDKKNDRLLAALCDDAVINIWKLPDGGLKSNLLQSDLRIPVSNERSTILKFHPCASDVLSTAGTDGALRIWDINKGSCLITCNLKNPSSFLSTGWNEIGSLVCSVSSDKKINIFDPRSSSSPIITSDGFQGSGSGRIIYADENQVFISGFTPLGNRIIGLKDTRKDNDFIVTINLNNAPSVLIPQYDIDTKVVYLSGK